MIDTKDYKSENCEVTFLSDLSGEDAEEMIGKIVAGVDAREYEMTIRFTDGSSVTCRGARWDGCSMGVDYRADTMSSFPLDTSPNSM